MAEEDDVNWAVIPAAGLGTRMSENAVLGCKELIEVGGLTMLERTIREVEEAGRHLTRSLPFDNRYRTRNVRV